MMVTDQLIIMVLAISMLEFLLAHSIKDKMLTREKVVRVFK